MPSGGATEVSRTPPSPWPHIEHRSPPYPSAFSDRVLLARCLSTCCGDVSACGVREDRVFTKALISNVSSGGNGFHRGPVLNPYMLWLLASVYPFTLFRCRHFRACAGKAPTGIRCSRANGWRRAQIATTG